MKRRWAYDLESVSITSGTNTLHTDYFRWRWMARLSRFLMSIAPQYAYPFTIPTEIYEVYIDQ